LAAISQRTSACFLFFFLCSENKFDQHNELIRVEKKKSRNDMFAP